MKSRRIIWSFVVLVMVLSLVACGTPTETATTESTTAEAQTSDSTTEAVTEEEITLSWVTGAGVLHDAAAYAAETFHAKYPNITVNIIDTDVATYYENGYQVLTADGGTYDMAFYWKNAIWKDLAENGVFLPLNDLYESENWIDAIGQGTADLYKLDDGNYYSVCDNFVWIGNVFYNKVIFDQYGLEVPTTEAELNEIAETLRANGIIPMAVSGSTGYTEHLFDTLMVRMLTDDQYAKICDGSTKYDDLNYESPEMLAVYDKILEMVDVLLQEGVSTMETPDAEALFVQGRAAMFMQTSTGAGTGYFTASDVFEPGYFIFPEIFAGESSPVVTYPGNCVSICSTTQYPEECKLFIAHYMSAEVQSVITSSNWLTSTRNDIDTSGLSEMYQQCYADMAERGTVAMWCFDAGGETQAVQHEVVQSLYAKIITAQEAGQMFQAAADSDRG